MYDDDDIETPAAAEPSEWDIPDLTLDFKGEKGSASFRSLEDLSGSHVERLRSQIGAAKNDGEGANVYYREALRILITAWDVPGKPTLAIPKGDPRALASLPAVVLRALERHIKPFMDRLMKETEGDPTPPASE